MDPWAGGERVSESSTRRHVPISSTREPSEHLSPRASQRIDSQQPEERRDTAFTSHPDKDEVHETFTNIDLGGELEKHGVPPRPGRRAPLGLVILLRYYDNQLVPELGVGVQFDSVLIVMVTIFRISLMGFVGSCLSQGAWLWVSEISQQRYNHDALLSDFSVFDGSSRGIRGSLMLLWRMKLKHLGCLGALIIILSHWFETFSQQMVLFEQRPRILSRGVDSGNTLDVPMDPAAEFNIFKVAPSNGSAHPIKSTNRAYFSVFDMLSLVQSEDQGLSVTGSECALWFCVQSFKLLVFDGTHNESKVGNWSTTELARGGNLHGSGYSFIGLPENMNADNTTTYSVSKEAIIALRTFMAGITTGVVRADTNMLDYSSDWVEAMWNATNNLEAWMGSFTEAMTAEFRINGRLSNGLGGTKVYAGSATQLAPFIRVQWWWMFYPGCMLLISFYYFFRTAVISARHGVSAWKGDALPMLFVRVDDNIHAHVGDGMDVPGGLTDRVGNIRIAMYRDEDGQWRFRSTRDDPKEV
ncbi:hypothetical protein SMACR_04982 [Sordaria macrospora]|uniref:WGS project CABT00000000 data, contig 2.8 n=2 Tax=Sordaria macrospora TaxID=5147 RepID=F7VUM7_SORMK|nr:uncharacterized protein SMAC_04982 [Sordaria macrospora k-hell]KAA8628560.1 hypothetical protein SMACR_04982 [Sordaria macrospora]KAH7628584.1 hypothetical protein B0T09DRAFT_267135 [Sordaria sp. MPI-SDFR-AT-0083]WPJ57478.1 hypothetical protein SMAC4_04982 [Sordaria macrospora]CCC09223.1 unnamed protein product [Sordaria macrospora k-hell]